jgi:hypothetical protein
MHPQTDYILEVNNVWEKLSLESNTKVSTERSLEK